ncbi:uncharacterized protein LOC112891077 [Panicum hallii]|uniref:uncharacterized protein LOC112891077 n=1 Tax=Panicum hallii TaxID=206008 RepID=UPI000DF4CB13|nr:uncharacterized protein LOC112891077 [Panicum hallii]XP_025813764.1 uncharacterized protein LOC112891077 [Panicum hallii]XP_025813765.1 uncharacterized protein LOC112891077 [Panicum hallii]
MEIHPDPVRDGRIGGIAQDVVGERVLAKGEEEKVPPLGEGRRGEVKHRRDESMDVEDAESLGVQGRDAGGVRVSGVIAGRGVASAGCGGIGVIGFLEEALRGSQGALVTSDVFLEAPARGGHDGRGVLLCLEGGGCLGLAATRGIGLLPHEATGLGIAELGSNGSVVSHRRRERLGAEETRREGGHDYRSQEILCLTFNFTGSWKNDDEAMKALAIYG